VAILITGGAGFIGRALARHFVAAGRDVLAFDVAAPLAAAGADSPAGVSYVSGDIRDAATVRAAVERSGGEDPIVHLAGMLTAGCDRDPAQGMAVNVGGSFHVLDAARACGGRRVVLASTIGVYGRGLPQPIDETMATEPDGWYGYTKRCAEEMGLLHARRHGLDFRAARMAAVTGPFRQAAGSASLFTSLIPEKAARGEPYAVEVSEDTAYPVVYLDDAASALARLATAPDAPQRIYNVASGRVVVREMIAHVRQFLPQARFTFAPDPVIMQVVSGYREWRIDCRLIGAELGWRPRFGVREMVDDIIRTVRGARSERL
jgi:nucleoside-diphosphate-sugar epimerase